MLGLLAMIGLTFGRGKSLLRPIFVTWPFIILIAMALLQTGSRGGLLALAAGVMALVLRRGTIMKKLLNGAAVLLVLGFFFLAALQPTSCAVVLRRQSKKASCWVEKSIRRPGRCSIQTSTRLGPSPTLRTGIRLGHPEEETKIAQLNLFGLVSNADRSLPLFIGIAYTVVSAWKTRHGPWRSATCMIAAVLVET